MTRPTGSNTAPESGASLAIRTKALTKVYGDTRALDGLELSVPTGGIFGFLGPNGAGKTTTLRILTGLARPTSGSAVVLGDDATAARTRVQSRIGFLPDVPGFYPWMKADDVLLLTAGLFGMTRDESRQRAGALLEMVGLAGVRSRVGGFSRGMKQRLGVAQALVNAPDLLLLDEPTSALDPLGRKEVLDTIAALRGRTTVFFSSHILADVERVCDTVGILDQGRIVKAGRVEDLRQVAGARVIRVRVDGESSSFVSAVEGRRWVDSVEADGPDLRITASDPAEAQREIPRAVAETGLGLVRFEIVEATLEDVFVALVGKPGVPRQGPSAEEGDR